MNYVIGVDLGTSAVKVLLVNKEGKIHSEVTKSYPLIQDKSGYSEQDPEQWVIQTKAAISELISDFYGDVTEISGISFSGQMHGLVLLDNKQQVLRNAILWNDTRTTEECHQINKVIGKQELLDIAKNPALEGFTLPKLLWVKEYEPELFNKANIFLLPKDYLRFRITREIHSEYSDAAGTLLLDVENKTWSKELCEKLGIDEKMCPPLVESHEEVGCITEEFSQATGLARNTKVFAGGADNACGAIGSGVLSNGKTLCSIGTSGVVLSYEGSSDRDFGGSIHYFNHGKENAFITMGVTLAAGYSLSWFKDVFARDKDFNDLLKMADQVPVGAKGLLYTPFIAGERTPYADSTIRGSFIGMDDSHQLQDFVRAVIEGITFSLNESIHIFRESGMNVDTIISIGGGAKNDSWLQIQADVFNANIIKLSSEQGPGIGAAMLAAYGCGWYSSLEECSNHYLETSKIIKPIRGNVEKYQKLFNIYQKIYSQTKELNDDLKEFR